MRYIQARIETVDFVRLKDYTKRNKVSIGYVVAEATRKWLNEQNIKEEVGKTIVSAIDKVAQTKTKEEVQ